MKIKNTIKRISLKQIQIIICVVIVLVYGFIFLNETKRTEENDIYCRIIKQDNENNTQIEYPDGKTEWIELKDEKISEDGKYVLLRVIRYFNRINQLKYETLMYTWIKTNR